MPIIDVAKEPLEKLASRWHRRALPYFLWLRILRPLSLLSLWAIAMVYAWQELTAAILHPTLWHDLPAYVCGIALLGVLAGIMAIASLRRLQRSEGLQPPPQTSVDEVARYAGLPPDSLADWQSSALLSVEHDEQGRMRHALAVSPGDTVPAGLHDFPAVDAWASAQCPAAVRHASPPAERPQRRPAASMGYQPDIVR